ncbi:MAG: magnesium chelatase [Chloroflexota bacterium]
MTQSETQAATIDQLPRTLGKLRASGYRSRSVREEIRENLVRKIERGETLFPGIHGYEQTALPEIENALLSGQDIIILGERGQAKSRMIRAFVDLLDDHMPVVAGSEINDDPLEPISKYARELVAEKGDETPVDWVPRDARYGEKLATPDVTMTEMLGDVDPIKVAEGRYLSDELTIHYGLIPRTNRGVFCINELPDLAERIQVGLFNLMEERDVQIKGYRVRLPLDVLIVATANPEDYTNRGRIITPLKDRYGAQVRTHYPHRTEDELRIVEQERSRYSDSEQRVRVPAYISEIIAELTSLARKSPEVNQRSGVSVRMTTANLETVRSAAYRRALRHGEATGVPRISDLPAVIASTRGKLELETIEEGREVEVIEDLTKRAVLEVFNRHVDADGLLEVVSAFESGLSVEAGADMPAEEYVRAAGQLPAIDSLFQKLSVGDDPAEIASALEFILEGLHLNRMLNRDTSGDNVTYSQQYDWSQWQSAGGDDPGASGQSGRRRGERRRRRQNDY